MYLIVYQVIPHTGHCGDSWCGDSVCGDEHCLDWPQSMTGWCGDSVVWGPAQSEAVWSSGHHHTWIFTTAGYY